MTVDRLHTLAKESPNCVRWVPRTTVTLTFLFVLSPVLAAAEQRFAVGASVTRMDARSHDVVQPPLLLRPQLRVQLSKLWVVEGTFEWYETDVNDPFGRGGRLFGRGSRLPDVGRLNVKPLLAGLGYTVRHGRARTTWSFVGGPAWNRLNVAGREHAADVDKLTDLSLAVRPGVGVDVRITSGVSLTAFGGYVFNRPYFRVSRAGDDPVNRWTADALVFNVGVLFSIW